MGTAETAAAAGGASPPSLLLTAKSPPDAVAALAASLVPSWSDLPPSSLEVAVISGGITNALWSVAVKESPSVNENVSPRRVAVRAYGDRTDLLIDRALEVRTLLLLNAKGFGAKVLAGFEGGRVEEFLPGRALTPEETARPETAERIARGLARLHAVDFKKEKKKEKREGEKETSRFSLFPSSCLSLFSRRQRASSSSSTYREEDSQLFSTIRDWIALADRLDAEKEGGERGKEEATATANSPPPSVGSAELRAEVADLEEKVRALSCCRASKRNASCPELSRVVFCHMDLLPGNIMTTDSEEEMTEIPPSSTSSAAAAAAEKADEKNKTGPGRGLQFIDFEYGRPCPAGFDVGNHWCEYAGLDCDWSRYPTREQRRAFAKAYLSEAAAISSSSTSSSSSLSSPPLPPPPSEEEERVSAFVDQAELFSLAAHLFWTAWARVQVHVSPIDFDYAQYARSRFEDYGRRKKGAAAAFVARS